MAVDRRERLERADAAQVEVQIVRERARVAGDRVVDRRELAQRVAGARHARACERFRRNRPVDRGRFLQRPRCRHRRVPDDGQRGAGRRGLQRERDADRTTCGQHELVGIDGLIARARQVQPIRARLEPVEPERSGRIARPRGPQRRYFHRDAGERKTGLRVEHAPRHLRRAPRRLRTDGRAEHTEHHRDSECGGGDARVCERARTESDDHGTPKTSACASGERAAGLREQEAARSVQRTKRPPSTRRTLRARVF
jgi:hypothetical protein